MDAEALPEPSWTDKEEKPVCILNFLDEPCLVNVVAVVSYHVYEVHHSVWYPFSLCHNYIFFMNSFHGMYAMFPVDIREFS